MADNKTKPSKSSVAAFIDGLTDPTMRADAKALVRLMQSAVGEKPQMWGPSIIGFGSYHYRYDSGREGDMPLIAFSPRKSGRLAVNSMTGPPSSVGRCAKARQAPERQRYHTQPEPGDEHSERTVHLRLHYGVGGSVLVADWKRAAFTPRHPRYDLDREIPQPVGEALVVESVADTMRDGHGQCRALPVLEVARLWRNHGLPRPRDVCDERKLLRRFPLIDVTSPLH